MGEETIGGSAGEREGKVEEDGKLCETLVSEGD